MAFNAGVLTKCTYMSMQYIPQYLQGCKQTRFLEDKPKIYKFHQKSLHISFQVRKVALQFFKYYLKKYINGIYFWP